MARDTADALLDMNAVIEKNEIRQLIDAVPFNGLAAREAFPHRRQDRRILPDLRMTGHAGLRGRQPGEGGILNGRVAITAIDSEAGYVVLVTERHGLGEGNRLRGGVRRAIDGIHHAPETEYPEESRANGSAGETVAAFSKNLRHYSSIRVTCASPSENGAVSLSHLQPFRRAPCGLFPMESTALQVNQYIENNDQKLSRPYSRQQTNTEILIMMTDLEGKRVAILVADGFEQVELTGPRDALEEAGAETEIVSPADKKVRGWDETDWGSKFKVDVHLDQADAGQYDALLLPGGVMNPDKLRLQPGAIAFIRAFFDAGKPVAAICHGPWTLIDAGVVKGRRLTSYPSIQADLKNAGADWVDEEVVVDNGLVTSRKPDDLPAFNRKMIEEFGEGMHAAPRAGVSSMVE